MHLSAPPSRYQVKPVNPRFTADKLEPTVRGPVIIDFGYVGGSALAAKPYTVFPGVRGGRNPHLNGLGDFQWQPQYAFPIIGNIAMQNDLVAYGQAQAQAQTPYQGDTIAPPTRNDALSPVKTATLKPMPQVFVDKTQGTPNVYVPPNVSTPLAPSSPTQQPQAGASSLPPAVQQMSFDVAPQIPSWLIWGGVGLAALMFYMETR